ncbi:hypothetical protein ZEAMMB73_Zm00001d014415, partial [Zea mays]
MVGRKNRACKKFRLASFKNEEDLEIMFSGVSCTNAYAMAPGAKEGLPANDSDDVEEMAFTSSESNESDITSNSSDSSD